jgi:hypothetical protein
MVPDDFVIKLAAQNAAFGFFRAFDMPFGCRDLRSDINNWATD